MAIFWSIIFYINFFIMLYIDIFWTSFTVHSLVKQMGR